MVETNKTLAAKAYKDYSNRHAMLLLHIIQARQLEPLSEETVERIAKAIIYCGDYFPEDIPDHHNQTLPKTMAFMQSVMDATSLSPRTTVNEAIQRSCQSDSSIPVICPATTTICALYYLHRFKTKFGIFTRASCVSHRLFLVAYLVAAKFIHANIQSLVMDPIPPAQLDASTLLSHLSSNTCLEPIDATQLSSMEDEFLHFLDYQLLIGPSNPLQLWSWFYTVLDDYYQHYQSGNYEGTRNVGKTATAS